MGVALLRPAENFALEIAEGGEQRDCSVTLVIMGARADVSHAQRQTWLGSLQRLALALLITAQNQSLVRRIEVEPNHIPELFVKKRVRGQLEGAGKVRLDIVVLPDAAHTVVGYPRRLGHAAHT